jgi:hypothetical protein
MKDTPEKDLCPNRLFASLNFIDLHPHVETSLPHDMSLCLDWIFQWRESIDDVAYAVPGFLNRAADGGQAKFVGHRPGA